LHGGTKNRRSTRKTGASINALLLLAALSLLPSSVRAAIGLSLPSDSTSDFRPVFRYKQPDSIPSLELGSLFPSAPPPQQLRTATPSLELGTLLPGPRSMLACDPDTVTLDLRTFRAFQNQDQVVKTWNRDILLLMKKSDREKSGPLRIGVELPAAVASIVGEGGAGLQVSGNQRISFAGRSQWSDVASTSARSQSKFPSLTMEQVNRFTVEGTIGSKVFVKVDQDSKRQTDLENRIQIRYKGDEDDILQTVELGNTTLSLPNTQFVGYSQSIQGLFGLKATATAGPMDLTMITSQEKGNTVRNRFTAGANENVVTIRDFDYAKGRFYDLGRIGDSTYIHSNGGDVITTFYLFRGVGDLIGSDIVPGSALTDVLHPDRYPGDSLTQNFKQLTTPDQYVMIQDPVKGTSYVYFPMARSEFQNSVLAYYMEVRRNGVLERQFGDMSSATYRLQLLKRSTSIPTDPLWVAEWKNVYDLRVQNLKYEDLDLDIYKGQRGTEANPVNLNNQSGEPYLRLLGLDRTGPAGSGPPDNKVDNDIAILDLYNGLLIFSNRRPFDDSSLTERVTAIYDNSNSDDLANASKYYFKLTTRQRSTSFSLGRVNIMSESEVVTLNGSRLTRGVDYDIDYDIGRISFKGDRIINDVVAPSAQVTIDYEYAPFMMVDKRSLFGIRGEYKGGQNFHTGATFLYKGSKATDRPAQLGSEPFRDMVLDYDVYWKTDAGFLTRLANALPVVKTESPSNLTFSGEVARSMPNPNTKGKVFIDDFESAKRSSGLGVLRETWTIASPPRVPGDFQSHRSARGLYDPALIWFNPFNQFNVTDVYNRDVRNQAESRTHVLVLEFRPEKSIIRDSAGGPWAGIMRSLVRSSWDQSKAEYLELRIAIVGKNPGQLHIDLGRITEDVDLNDIFDTENKDASGLMTDEKDVGLDGKPDSAEVGPHGEPYNAATNPDPAGDNWAFDPNPPYNYEHINGTEKNFVNGGRVGRPDTEDIGGESRTDRVDSYISYSLDLANPDKSILVEGSDKTSNDKTGYVSTLVWRTYRIPLWDSTLPGYSSVWDTSLDPAQNAPSPSNIQFARIWMDGTLDTTRVYIAAIDMVQSAWKGSVDTAKVQTDSLITLPPFRGRFRVAVKNTEENSDYVQDPPPGVGGYVDPTTQVREKEQSLILVYEKFQPGDTGRARLATPVAQDFTGYRFLRMLVHGDRNADSLTRMYYRFGQDSANYYYYSDVVRPGWTGNGVEVDFDRLTVLKQKAIPDSSGKIDVFDSTHHIGVKGLPSLSRVSYMEIGVLRTGTAADTASSGEIWCDELRLEDVRRDAGIAARIRLTTQMADLLGFTANVDAQNYAFRTLNEGRSGSVLNSSSQLRMGVSGSILLSKFVPQSWGLNLPVSVNFSQDVATPKLLTGSDVVLDKELQQHQRSTNIADGASASIKWTPPTKNWLVNSTLGALSGTFSVNRQRGWSPTTPYRRSEGYNAGAVYTLQFRQRLTFPPLYWMRFLLLPRRLYNTRLSLLPTSFSASGSVARSQSLTVNSNGLATSVYNRSFDGNSRVALSPIPSVTVSYNMTTRRDLSNPDELELTFNPKRFRLGREQRFVQRFSADYKPTLFAFLTHGFSYSADFNDQIDNVSFNHSVQVTRSWSANGTFDLAKFWSTLGYAKPKPKPRAPTPSKTDTKKAGDKKEDSKTGTQKGFEEEPKGSSKAGNKGEESAPGRRRDDTQFIGPRQEDKGLAGDAAQQPKAGVYGPPTPDSTKKGQHPGEGMGGFGPFDAWRAFLGGLDWVTTPIGPMSVTLQHNEGDNRATRQRPTWQYQFGFSQDPGVDPASGNTSAAGGGGAQTKGDNLGVKNQLKFGNILTFSNSYGLSLSERNQSGSISRAKSLTFPALSTSLDRLERFKPITWFFTNASARFGFNQKIDSSWTGSLMTSAVKTTNFSPLLNLTGTIKKTIRFALTMDRNKTETSSEQAGIKATERYSRSWRVNADYSFSSPKGIPLPFLRKIRLKSQMSISVAVTGKSGEAYDIVRDTTSGRDYRRLTQTSSEFTVTPQGNYSFSVRVKGGFTAQWSDIMDNSPGSGRRKSHIRSLGIWAEFSF